MLHRRWSACGLGAPPSPGRGCVCTLSSRHGLAAVGDAAQASSCFSSFPYVSSTGFYVGSSRPPLRKAFHTAVVLTLAKLEKYVWKLSRKLRQELHIDRQESLDFIGKGLCVVQHRRVVLLAPCNSLEENCPGNCRRDDPGLISSHTRW